MIGNNAVLNERVLPAILASHLCLFCTQLATAEDLRFPGADAPIEEDGGECSGEQLGTSITWYRDSKDASRLAREQDKLVFLIQVSGNFAREEFT